MLAKQQEPLCLECFEFSLNRTIRHTVRTKCLIEPRDNVLVALSGGASSLALLMLLQELHASKQNAANHGQVNGIEIMPILRGMPLTMLLGDFLLLLQPC